jgi:hypothetical protein
MQVKRKVFGFIKKTTSYGTEKMYLLYIFPLALKTLRLRCSNFFNPSKKNVLVVLQIGNRKSQ